ncbi:MoaD/ThiS family protein [Aquimarina litoralis]|uniref:MoaD/ThiS family protein n=1 Tax=Aquimarina litoralis TaxID=584605 RepID=UPI001C58AF3D|nr:MoaD/ThiS family protein [Aquimarina litoralis]MBW1297674.1 MoaD/ThiS family protein [Aquimarina litoralis]
MKLKVLYFGMIAEAVNCKEEEISLQPGSTVEQLSNLLISKYEKLNDLSFNIAVNKEILNQNIPINSNSEIALLPPFAGG